jgi:TetR/AcrR family transcriptional regulator
MVNSRSNTEEKILVAAKKVFHRKGFEGARMQEIADEAGINKALLHYYFRNKENLFEAVFKEAFGEIMFRATDVFLSDKPMMEKIQEFLVNYLDVLAENSYIPWFIINGIYERPEQIKAFFDQHQMNPPKLMELLKEQIKEEFHTDINPLHFWLNILSLCIFPVVAKPLITQIFQLPEAAYEQLLEERKTIVPQFIINALKSYEEGPNQ